MEQVSDLVPGSPLDRPRRNQPCARPTSHGDGDLLTGLDPAHQIRGLLAKLAQSNCAHATGVALVLRGIQASCALLAAWCAMRFGELAELRRGDLDLKNNRVKIRRAVVRVRGEMIVGPPETDAGTRDVAIPPHLVPAVEHHLEAHVRREQDALLFPASDGATHMQPSTRYKSGTRPGRRPAGRTCDGTTCATPAPFSRHSRCNAGQVGRLHVARSADMGRVERDQRPGSLRRSRREMVRSRLYAWARCDSRPGATVSYQSVTCSTVISASGSLPNVGMRTPSSRYHHYASQQDLSRANHLSFLVEVRRLGTSQQRSLSTTAIASAGPVQDHATSPHSGEGPGDPLVAADLGRRPLMPMLSHAGDRRCRCAYRCLYYLSPAPDTMHRVARCNQRPEGAHRASMSLRCQRGRYTQGTDTAEGRLTPCGN